MTTRPAPPADDRPIESTPSPCPSGPRLTQIPAPRSMPSARLQGVGYPSVLDLAIEHHVRCGSLCRRGGNIGDRPERRPRSAEISSAETDPVRPLLRFTSDNPSIADTWRPARREGCPCITNAIAASAAPSLCGRTGVPRPDPRTPRPASWPTLVPSGTAVRL